MKMNVRGWLIGLAAWALAMTAGAQYQQIVNNQTLTGLSDTAGDEKIFMVYAPTVGTLEVKTWGGTGNANLYVRHGAVPTTTVYDHRSMGATNNEEVSDPHASTGWHYIMIKAQTAYSDLNVRFRFWSELYNGQYLPVMPVAGAQASSRIFRFWVPQGQDLLRVQTGGGTGDADLYLKHDDFPTTADYDHRSFLSGNNETINVTSPAWGWWYAMVHGYTAYNGLNIVKAYAGSLSNGAVMIVGLSADANAWKFMTINVASQAQYFHVQSWGGTGNANLHVGPDLLAGSMGGWLQSAGPTNDEELRPPGPIAAGLQWIGLQGPQAFNDCRVGATYANATPQPVTFNPPGGTYAGSQSVFLSTTTPNFTIRYTTDGSDVNYGSPRYSSPIHVSATRTIKARVFSTTTVPGASYWATYTIGLTSPIFRFYSPVSGSHFYTRNQAERDHLIANLSHAWNYEGTAWHAFATQAANTTPIYRFYSPLSGSHFYTRNEAEKDHIIANLSHAWNYEGISWYAYATQAANTVPVYRFYSPVSGSHFYTRNQAERDHIIANLSHAWSYEGISYYAFAAPAGSSLGSPEVGDAMAAPGPAAPDFTALATDALTVGEPANVAGDEAAGGVFFPLTMDDTYVTAAVYDPAAAEWDQVLPVTWAPGGIACANLRRGQPYWLAVLAHEAETESWVFEHGSWFGRRTAPAADVPVLEEPPTALGLPIETIRLPEADAPLTLQLYCPIEERNVLTATGLESGSAYDLIVPAWNRQYRLDVFDAHGEVVLASWLGHLRTH